VPIQFFYQSIQISPFTQNICSGSAANIYFNQSFCPSNYINYNMNLPLGVTSTSPEYGYIDPWSTNFNPIFYNSTNATQVVDIYFYSNCQGGNAIQILVEPNPSLAPTPDQIICCGSNTSPIVFNNSSNSQVCWSNSNTSIGLPANGCGDIQSFTPLCASLVPQSAYIIAQSNGICGFSLADTFMITTIPSPFVNPIPNQSICNGTSTNPIVFSGTGTEYIWTAFTNVNVTGYASSGTGNIGSLNLINNSPSTQSIVFSVTPKYTYNGVTCIGNSQTFSITVYPSTTLNYVTASNCDFYNWNGVTYTESGTYQYQGYTTNGCDSIVNLNLTIFKSYSGLQDTTVCEAYLWPVNNQTYTQSGTYNFQTFTTNGCDSTIILNLTIENNSNSIQDTSACGAFTWSVNNQTYSQSGTYTYQVQSSSGCDSLFTLNLLINLPPNPPIVNVSTNLNGQITCSTPLQSNATYQWLSCPDYILIPGATNSSYNPTDNGNYAVVVSNVCGSDTSLCQGQNSLEENDNSEEIILYPNPSNGLMVIDAKGVLDQNFVIYSMEGRKLQVGILTNGLSVLNVQSFADGTYNFQIGRKQIRFVIQK
jgi:hypothetical protein